MHHSYKTTSYRSRPILKTTVVMLGYAEKDEMYLLAIIHQRLIISGDVELNPGPLGGEQILHSPWSDISHEKYMSITIASVNGVGTS